MFWNKKKEESKPVNINVYDIPATTDLSIDKITPEEIQNAIESERDENHLQDIHELYTLLMENDDTVAGNLDTRLESLKSKKPSVVSEHPEKELLYYQNIIDVFWSDLVDLLIDYKMRGYILSQIEYEIDNGIYMPKRFITYENKSINLFKKDNHLILKNDCEEEIALDNLKFITGVKRKSILRALLKYYVFFSFALNNWASFTEIYGKPIRKGKYRAGASKTEKNELWSMLQSAGNDLSFMHSESVDIEFVDYANKASSSNLYQTLVNFCKEAKTTRILGQTLTTNAEKSGSYAQAKVHNLVRTDILAGDARDACEFISEILHKLSIINFSGAKPKLEIDISEKPTQKEQLEMDAKLLNDVSIEIEPEYFYKKYNIPEPKGGAKYKEKPASNSFPQNVTDFF